MTLIECLLPARNILVYDVAASSSGALSVLNDFYNEVKNYDDKRINWIFVISTPQLDETENIKVVRLPWVKKSWIHRLFCDHFIAPNFIKKHNIDKVFSLQNVLVPSTNVPQVLYLHQPLPFADYRFKLTENYIFWVYQNIISKFIFLSIKKAEKIIVQTNWMKKSCIEKTGVKENNILVIPPVINIVPKKYFSYENMNIPTFIYPATALIYKNHQIIIDACKQLLAEGITTFQVIFTLNGNENELSRKLFEQTKKHGLPIKFIGSIPREELFEWYTKSILIFPSYIETFGLPLLEAKIHMTPIIASYSEFGREILIDYKNTLYFSCFDKTKLLLLLNSIINDDICQ
jgi:glycosyltransferase involved in cell wall biosynthesis